MAVTYSATLKTNRMQLVMDLIGNKVAAASTGSFAAGTLVIGTSTLSGATGVLATAVLSATPFSISGGTITLLAVPITTTASATGTAALADLRNTGGTAIVTGLTVATTGSDVIIANVNVTSGQTVSVNLARSRIAKSCPSVVRHSFSRPTAQERCVSCAVISRRKTPASQCRIAA
jgi:hypothetical protein